MFNATVRDCQTDEEFRSKLGIEHISEVMGTSRLYQFGYVEKRTRMIG